jgi:hypothetical protein
MDDLFSKFKNFILPAFILIQLLIIALRKFIEKKKDIGKRKKWEEYAKRLGLILKETSDSKQPYITFRISNYNCFLIEVPISGGIREGLAFICELKNTGIDKNFSIVKKIRLREKKSISKRLGSLTLNIDDIYTIKGDNENFKRKLLNSRVITHLLRARPESLSFFDMNDTKSTLIPEKVDSKKFLILTSNISHDYNRLSELMETCRIIVKTLDAI